MKGSDIAVHDGEDSGDRALSVMVWGSQCMRRYVKSRVIDQAPICLQSSLGLVKVLPTRTLIL